jgi:hypothetical protein
MIGTRDMLLEQAQVNRIDEKLQELFLVLEYAICLFDGISP